MGDNPKLDRSFSYDSVNVYYKYKIAHYGKPDDLVLPTIMFETPDQLCAHLETVARERSIPLDSCVRETPYLWTQYIASYPETVQQEIWKYREYVYACSVIFIGQYIQSSLNAGSRHVLISSIPRIFPVQFAMNDHKFTIVGSATLSSDIDITIQGPHASFLISLLEDLYEYMSYTAKIPIRCWDVEFYGDFKILQSLFVNMSRFTNSQRGAILLYAMVSYFRSSHKTVTEVSPLVTFLVEHCLKIMKSTQTADLLIQGAYHKYITELPDGKMNRELFYRELKEVEDNSQFIKPYLKTLDNDKIVSNNTALMSDDNYDASFIFTLFYGITRGNTHRPESYIVPSTAVHVVEFEQKKGGMFTNALPEAWVSSNARIGIDTFGFIISAIEQLGYLEHYHDDSECNKKGIKYFGRLVRALVQAGLLKESSRVVGVSSQLNAYRGSTDPAAVCGQDVHSLLDHILNTIRATGISIGSLRLPAIRRLNIPATRRKRNRRFRKTRR